ncbi:ribonuclease P protein component [Cardinium endosymbiont of Sogatella furcifera]|uniref:ribonuclease P protein component n=1 Tax=Cardinium endosymbiont of Sogatella furcifera TaxID=650378 RepID=UPI000E0CDF5C|nr:ribonuclease P protein component [Cardinium endosymbiont of Sogatella furcifera]AXI24259.1 ribonuclease P protein component [Cardinium endosymbiont of Sogatella furcifera]
MGKNNLPKCHRLTNRKHIKMLFQEGRRLRLHLCSVFYLQKKQEQFRCNQVLFAVSKRHLRSAVQRNKVKRLLREAYRINKYLLDDVLAPTGFAFLIGYVYTGKEEEIHYPILNKAVIRSLQHLSALLSQALY